MSVHVVVHCDGPAEGELCTAIFVSPDAATKVASRAHARVAEGWSIGRREHQVDLCPVHSRGR